jgi:hypothetical protein
VARVVERRSAGGFDFAQARAAWKREEDDH